MLFVGYFEGLDSQRAIAWRCHDSRSLQTFLGFSVTEETPDHSSLTVIRKRLPLGIHEQVFAKVLCIAQEKKLLKGQSVAVDSGSAGSGICESWTGLENSICHVMSLCSAPGFRLSPE
jgi:transposase